MNVELLYFEGCPHWHTASDRLQQVAAEHGAIVRRRCVSEGERVLFGFAGSPTILINGRDPFPGGAPTPVLSCRLYQTPDGPAGSPTIEQIRSALGAVQALDAS